MRLSGCGALWSPSQDVSRHPGLRVGQFELPSDVTLSSFSEPVNEEPPTNIFEDSFIITTVASLWNVERVVRC